MRCTGQNQLLQRLSRRVSPRLQWLLSHTPSCRTAAGIYRKPAASLHRASANQQYHVQRGSFAESGHDKHSDGAFCFAQSAADRWRAAAGMPEVNIAACAACHGPEATGSGQIPRLAGQLYPYMIKTLSSWDKERGRNPTVPDAAAIMSPVAHSLNKSQIEAVAAFVSTLRSPRGTPNTVQ